MNNKDIKYIFGEGYNQPIKGNPLYKSVDENGKSSKCYNTWYNMLSRCYNKNNIVYDTYGGKGVKVCEEWKNFQVFAIWWHKEMNTYRIKGVQMSIDKDIRAKGDNFIYSPSTCSIIPLELNRAFGFSNSAFTIKRDEYVKRVYLKYKDYMPNDLCEIIEKRINEMIH